jgi:hypothetical protein
MYRVGHADCKTEKTPEIKKAIGLRKLISEKTSTNIALKLVDLTKYLSHLLIRNIRSHLTRLSFNFYSYLRNLILPF